MADKVAIMYGGKIVEFVNCHSILNYPAHPYTKAMNSPILDIRGISKIYRVDGNEICAVRNVSLAIEKTSPLALLVKLAAENQH